MGLGTDPYNCYTDGASRGNPGPAAYAFVLVDAGGREVEGKTEFIGRTTNNVAEYTAVIKALDRISRLTRGDVRIHSDSELVIRQLRGEYQVRKDHIRELFHRVKTLEKHFQSVEYLSVRRENRWIRVADDLCNRTLDAAGE